MEKLSRPSGIAIPLFLTRKWEKQQQKDRKPLDPVGSHDDSQDQNPDDNDGTVKSSNGSATNTWQPKLRLRPDQESTRDERNELSNRVFTTTELEKRIWKTTTAMFDIQRQLYRGEEIYYEDTYSHGSIYKGWDALVDMKDLGNTSASGSGGTQTSNRRLPVDSRWFSTSCSSISRTKPPRSFPPPALPQIFSTTEQLPSIPEQQVSGQETSLKAAPQPLPNRTMNSGATAATGTIPDTVQSSSSRIRQRGASSPATTSNATARSAEKTDLSTTSSISKPTSGPDTPISSKRNIDSGITKKKRKATTTESIEEPPFKKSNPKYPGSEPKAPLATKTAVTIAGHTKGLKSDNIPLTTKGGSKSTKSDKRDGSSSSGNKSIKAESAIPGKREKEVDTPVPRKRGRPRRKS